MLFYCTSSSVTYPVSKCTIIRYKLLSNLTSTVLALDIRFPLQYAVLYDGQKYWKKIRKNGKAKLGKKQI